MHVDKSLTFSEIEYVFVRIKLKRICLLEYFKNKLKFWLETHYVFFVNLQFVLQIKHLENTKVEVAFVNIMLFSVSIKCFYPTIFKCYYLLIVVFYNKLKCKSIFLQIKNKAIQKLLIFMVNYFIT